MFNELTQRLIEQARLPQPLTGEEARDFIASSYLQWIATHGLGAATVEDHVAALSRLSLASSLLIVPEEDRTPTAFVVAEAADVARIQKNETGESSELVQFRRAVHYLDLASFFHLSDYDANAGLVASKALELLESIVSFVQIEAKRAKSTKKHNF